MGYPIDLEYRARETQKAYMTAMKSIAMYRQAYPQKRSVKKKVAYRFVALLLKVWFSVRRFQGSLQRRRVRRA